jgi:DNA-binding MarR family transcriptional regulator
MPDASPSRTTAIAISKAMRQLRSRLRQESQPSPTELSMPQALALGRIREEGPIANAALAAAEHMRPQSMHEIVGLLESRGYVRRRVDPSDRRKLLIEATPAGRRIVDELMAIRHEWLAAAIDETLSPAERDILAVAAGLMERVALSATRSERAGHEAGPAR